MPTEGGWTSSAGDLHELSARLRATGQSGLKKNMAKAIRAATVPCRAAVRAELLEVMPHSGGLNVWMAKSSITSGVLTGAKSAGVVVRMGRRGSNVRLINQSGEVRHPVFGHRKVWRNTAVPTDWWEKALEPFGPAVRGALTVSMDATAKEAGFI